MRVRVVLAFALLLVVGVLVLDMSGRAPRTAGSDHVSTPIFAASVPGGGMLCQPVDPLPQDAARAQLVVGTYGRPVPTLDIRFLGANSETIASGILPMGAHEGTIMIPLAHTRAPGVSTKVCLHSRGRSTIVVAGEGLPVGVGSESVNGKLQPGRFGLQYFRPGEESWWQLLPTLSTRFGLGKTPVFGDWTLPLVALILLGVWIVTIRLLLRELP